MNIVRRTPELGDVGLIAAIASAGKELFSAKTGRIIETPGQAAALSMSAVAALAGALLLVVVLKKKHVI